ncbi:MAG: glycosyltransferase family 2 protein [Alphaproteobacteria bacterium]|nr:glycosyltransferase family 2 protein [Alphaproteobacteria bacterium]
MSEVGNLLIHWIGQASPWLSAIIITVGLMQNTVYLTQLVIAFAELRRHRPDKRSTRLWAGVSEVAPPISLLVPAFNEEATIVENIHSMLALQYPSFEVVVINDGSRDQTLEVVIAAFDLKPIDRSYERSAEHKAIRGLYGSPRYPNLVVVDKENGGKSDALNAGINLSRSPYFCAIDADSLLEPDALLRAVRPFVDDPERMIAVGGTIRIVNGSTVRAGKVVEVGLPRHILPLFQTVEYLRAYLMARLALSRLGILILISGAFGIFRRSAAVAVGGYSHGTVGEDLELVLKMHRHHREHGIPYRISYLPEPVCWTEAPQSTRVLARQRIRWQRGALETFFKHKTMLFNPRYGRLGMVGLPLMMIEDVMGPPIEILGYLLIPLLVVTGILGWEYFLALMALTIVFGIAISVLSLVLEEMELRRFPHARDLAVLMLAAVIENFGYRQLNNFWRVVGYWRYLRGAQGWGRMVRTGFRVAP